MVNFGNVNIYLYRSNVITRGFSSFFKDPAGFALEMYVDRSKYAVKFSIVSLLIELFTSRHELGGFLR